MARVGYRFLPTEEELLTILKNRSTGIAPTYGVVEKNLYGVDATPWKVLDDTEPWGEVVDPSSCKPSPNARVIYAITQLSKVGNGGKNRNWTAGCGTWHGSAKAKSIKNWMGQEIGTLRTLNFVSKTEMRGHWIMHEYALSGVLLGPGTSSDLVICRITRRFDESEAKVQGLKKRKAVFDGNQENQVPAISEDQESQHSRKKIKSDRSTGPEDGDERLQDWFVDMIEFNIPVTSAEETGGAAVNQQYQSNFEWVEAGQNNPNVGGEVGAAGASDQQDQNFQWAAQVAEDFQTVAGPSDQQHQNFEWAEQVSQNFQTVAGDSDQQHQKLEWASQVGQDFQSVTGASDQQDQDFFEWTEQVAQDFQTFAGVSNQQDKNFEWAEQVAQDFQTVDGVTDQQDQDFFEWAEQVAQDFQTVDGALDQQHQNFEFAAQVAQDCQTVADQQDQNFEWVAEVAEDFHSVVGASDQQHLNFEWGILSGPADQHSQNFGEEGQMGGSAVHQQDQNSTSPVVGYGLMTDLVANLFADEDSRGYQFPAEVVDNYLIPCIG